jgi:hypothetical protein
MVVVTPVVVAVAVAVMVVQLAVRKLVPVVAQLQAGRERASRDRRVVVRRMPLGDAAHQPLR